MGILWSESEVLCLLPRKHKGGSNPGLKIILYAERAISEA